MTVVLALCLVAAAAVAAYAQTRAIRADRARIAAENRAAVAEAHLGAAKAALVPLAWAYDHVQTRTVENLVEMSNEVRHYLVLAITNVQAAIGANEEEMAEILASTPEPPRRLPRYPQIPPYLAQPEDLA